MNRASCNIQLAFVYYVKYDKFSKGGEFIMKKYDPSQHYHIGYYEDGYDLEVTAYKRINEPVWDAYIPHYEAGDFYKKVEKMKLGEYVDDYGIMVYSFSNDMDDEEARIIFENWLKTNGIV
ncbi:MULTISPECIES: DUF3986 family protein [unclassified Bacillus (in: firmicutes)]|uniref:DUF3986 family protein n=1 Tax=unclassified Bacillus (in: firmicutes) TaxID=185979 RepID=UPI00178C5887|nr:MULTISPECIES: DUF3986 family protein [unclassified Bacillus (in: firmicutes)]